MSMYTKLKSPVACPFCGGADIHVAVASQWWVTCMDCDCDGPISSVSQEDAITLWSRRAQPQSGDGNV